MAKFRKKPVVIEAEQWNYDWHDAPEVVEGFLSVVCQKCDSNVPGGGDRVRCVPHIHTLEGDHVVSRGDWVIRGVKGEHYPCKPDIFDATYEPVE